MEQQIISEPGLVVTAGQVIGWLALGLVTVGGWVVKGLLRRLGELEGRVMALREDQLDDTRILKEVGRNEGSIDKLHERVDGLTERVIKLEAQRP